MPLAAWIGYIMFGDAVFGIAKQFATFLFLTLEGTTDKDFQMAAQTLAGALSDAAVAAAVATSVKSLHQRTGEISPKQRRK